MNMRDYSTFIQNHTFDHRYSRSGTGQPPLPFLIYETIASYPSAVIFKYMELYNKFTINKRTNKNVRENRRDNQECQEWIIQRHWAHKTQYEKNTKKMTARF